jgi:hypothetical protein
MDIPSQKQSLEDDLISELHFETEKRYLTIITSMESLLKKKT